MTDLDKLPRLPIDEVDVFALLAVLNRDEETLKSLKFHPRALIEVLRNNLEGLEFLLKALGFDPGAGGYFFSGVKNNKTFDLYKKYKITPMNLCEECVTPEQWKYMQDIKYITVDEYGHARRHPDLDNIESAREAGDSDFLPDDDDYDDTESTIPSCGYDCPRCRKSAENAHALVESKNDSSQSFCIDICDKCKRPTTHDAFGNCLNCVTDDGKPEHIYYCPSCTSRMEDAYKPCPFCGGEGYTTEIIDLIRAYADPISDSTTKCLCHGVSLAECVAQGKIAQYPNSDIKSCEDALEINPDDFYYHCMTCNKLEQPKDGKCTKCANIIDRPAVNDSSAIVASNSEVARDHSDEDSESDDKMTAENIARWQFHSGNPQHEDETDEIAQWYPDGSEIGDAMLEQTKSSLLDGHDEDVHSD